MRQMFSSLGLPNFRLYFWGQLVSQIGSWMQRAGTAWLVLEISNSPLALGVATALQFVPSLALGLFAGVLVDRLPKRPLLLTTQWLQLAQALALAALTWLGAIQLWQVYLLSILLGVFTAFDTPVRQVFVMDIVGRDKVANAVGLNTAITNVGRLVGPAIGGFTIAAFGAAVCFALNAVSFLAMLVALMLITPPPAAAGDGLRQGRRRVLVDIREGFAYVRQEPDLLIVAALLAVFGVFSWNFNVVVPLLTQRALNAGADVFGILLAGIGVGALAAALSWARGREYRRGTMLLAAGIFACFEAGSGLAPNVILGFVALVGVGYCHTIYNSASITALQLLPPEDLRGRTASLYTLLFLGLQPAGSLLSGYLAEAIGIRATIVLSGAVCLAAVAAASLYGRRAAASASAYC